MILIEVVGINLALISILWVFGSIPARFFCSRIPLPNPGFRLFLSLFSGYLLIQTVFAIWATRGLSMQWLNLIPFLMLATIKPNSGTQRDVAFFSLRDVWILGGVILIASAYFVASYSSNFIDIQRHPFVDLVSYAGSAYGMGQTGIEAYFSDKALYFPELSGLNLYHFTELWLTELLCSFTGKTELWITCFVLPVLLLGLVAASLLSFSWFRKENSWIQLIILVAFCFSYGKLLFFNDVFLYHILDLFGTKIALVLVAFVLVWQVRDRLPVFLSVLLFLPQINILLAPLSGILAIYAIARTFRRENTFPAPRFLAAYFLWITLFLIILYFGKEPASAGLSQGKFSAGNLIGTFFQYAREAVYNLGFMYWAPIIYLAALFRNRIYALILFPFFIGKGLGKLLNLISSDVSFLVPCLEFITCIAGLWWLNNKYLKCKPLIRDSFLIQIGLCLIAATGYSFTGFMDFEQLFTLSACSFFFLLAFNMLASDEFPKYPPLLSFRGKNFVLAFCLLALTWKTFRFQRSLPFDMAFYEVIGKEAGPISRSIYFSSMKFSPFPLHVKTGFPFLFHFPDAYATPVTQFEDSSWHGKNFAWHVKQFPFYIFCQLPENQGFSPEQNCLRFIKHFGIRFAWIDQSYAAVKLNYLKPYREKFWISKQEKKEFWKLIPEKIPLQLNSDSESAKSRP